ncbi:adenosine receptor A2b-like [Sardina pilchardus]|uniref:adenosine receptor A2b-like n=1 Tax=Sardina pilchardus TaxID=27697 RepID=UPI002E14C3CC
MPLPPLEEELPPHLLPGTSSTLNNVYIGLELLIALLAVAGNVLVCWAVSLNSNLQSITNYFVVSLAVADIAVGLLAIPFAVAISTGFCSHFHGCLFIACFVLVLTQGSIFSLLAIAIDRYIAIKIPLRYNSLVTGRRAKGIIAICWILSVVIGLTPMLGWNKGLNATAPALANINANANASSPVCPAGMTRCLFEDVVSMDYMVYFNFFGCVLAPLLAMLGIYTRIFMAARRQLRLMDLKLANVPRHIHQMGAGPASSSAATSSSSSSASRSTLQKEVHAAKCLAIIVGLFAVCWLPVHILNCLTLFCGPHQRPEWIIYLAIILSHGNSVVNPFIYAYRIREFRHTFRRIIRQNLLPGRSRRLGGLGGGAISRIGNTSSPAVSMVDSTCTVVNGYALEPSPKLGPSPGASPAPRDGRRLGYLQEGSAGLPRWDGSLGVVLVGYTNNGRGAGSDDTNGSGGGFLHTPQLTPQAAHRARGCAWRHEREGSPPPRAAEVVEVKDCGTVSPADVRSLFSVRTNLPTELTRVS